MKKEMPIGMVAGIIALLLLIVVGMFFLTGRAPSTPEEAGAGLPAKAGGGVVEPTQDPAGSRPSTGQ